MSFCFEDGEAGGVGETAEGRSSVTCSVGLRDNRENRSCRSSTSSNCICSSIYGERFASRGSHYRSPRCRYCGVLSATWRV